MNACTEYAEPEVDIMRMLCTHRWCYAACADEKIDAYVPALVFENHSGRYPLYRNGEKDPWIIGSTWEEADKVCRRMNAKLGVTPDDEGEIVGSSMRIR